MKTIDIFFYAHNQEAFVKKGLESIARQTLADANEVNVLCLDDGSRDSTGQIMREWVETMSLSELHAGWSFEYRSRADGRAQGQTSTYFEGLAWSKSSFLAVLEGDDYWFRKDHVSTLVADLEENAFASAAFSSWVSLDSDNQFVMSRVIDSESRVDQRIVDTKRLLRENPPGTLSACVYRRESVQLVLERGKGLEDLADWGTNLIASQLGPILWNPNISLIYNYVTDSLWRKVSELDQKKKMIQLLEAYAKLMTPAVRPIFNEQILALANQVETKKRILNAIRHPFLTIRGANRLLKQYLSR